MSEELERIKKSMKDLVKRSVDACSKAYLLEFQKECQAKGSELAAAAAKIKKDRQDTLDNALNANDGRFRKLREKNYELRKQEKSLSQDEQNELNSYEDKLREALKPIKKAEEDLKKESTPFDKIYKIIYDLSLQKQNDPNLDISKAFDEYKDTTEYKPEDEWKRITDNDKLLTAFYLKDFAQNYGIPFAKIGQVVPDPKKAPKEYSAYMESMDKMIKTANKYMIGGSKVKNGETLVDSGIFNETNSGLISMANILFGSKNASGRDIVGDTYKRLIDFCNKKAAQMIVDNLDKGKVIPGSPYFDKQNPEYADHLDQMKIIKESVKFLTKEDKKSLADRELDKVKLAFGKSGSDQFNNMETAYKDFQKKLNDYIKNPGDSEKKQLLQNSIETLDKNAEAYLKFKDGQIRNKEIDIKKVVENGKAKAVPTNEKTLQRMKFAEKIREDMSKQRELFAGKGAKPVKEQELNNSQSIPSL